MANMGKHILLKKNIFYILHTEYPVKRHFIRGCICLTHFVWFVPPLRYSMWAFLETTLLKPDLSAAL